MPGCANPCDTLKTGGPFARSRSTRLSSRGVDGTLVRSAVGANRHERFVARRRDEPMRCQHRTSRRTNVPASAQRASVACCDDTGQTRAFLAVALPTLAALIASLSSVDLTYQLRAGAEIIGIGDPDRRQLDVHGRRPAMVRPAMGCAGPAGLAYDGARLDRPGPRACRAGGGDLRLYVPRRREAGLANRYADVSTLAAFTVAAPALALRPQLDSAITLAPPAAILSRRAEHPAGRLVHPVAGPRTGRASMGAFPGPLAVGLTWLTDVRSGAEPRHRPRRDDREPRDRLPDPIGPAADLCGRAVDRPERHVPDHTEWQRTDADETSPACCSTIVAAVAFSPRLADRWSIRRCCCGWRCSRRSASTRCGASPGGRWRPVPVAATLLAAGRSPSPERAGTRAMQRVNMVVALAMVLVGFALLPVWRTVDPRTGTPQGLVTDAPPGVTSGLRGIARAGDTVQPAALGLVGGIRRAGAARHRRLARRALPRDGLGRL